MMKCPDSRKIPGDVDTCTKDQFNEKVGKTEGVIMADVIQENPFQISIEGKWQRCEV